MIPNNRLILSSMTIGLSLCLSCTTAQSAPQKEPTKTTSASPKTTNTSTNQDLPPKIQLEFQNEFARQLVKAGDKAEGWALFSDSGMGHNGQRWIIRTNDPKNNAVTLCVIKQGDSTCKISKISSKQFTKIGGALKKADQLEHIIPAVFDGITFEYLHATSSVPMIKRLVFLTNAKPLPPEYESLIQAFKP
jgi:hypothetical protein